MTTDNFLDTLHEAVAMLREWRPQILIAAVLLALILLVIPLRKAGKKSLAGLVTGVSTFLGMAWSAQGMWDTAVHRYGQNEMVASVLFFVFEAFLFSRMLRAHQYRADLARRGKHIKAVWTGAVVMAVVVAAGEGWAQAPGRLAIPLLVTYGWYTDLTAADNPTDKLATSWRWTPRRIGLALGLLEPGARDAQQIDRDALRDRMTRLAFRIHYGTVLLNDVFRRPTRLARLKTMADDIDLADVRARLARMKVDLMVPAPAKPSGLLLPTKRIELPAEARRPMGVHEIDGVAMRGQELRRDAVARLLASVTPAAPRGMSNAELAALYSPPLGARTAEQFGSEARKQINGHPVG